MKNSPPRADFKTVDDRLTSRIHIPLHAGSADYRISTNGSEKNYGENYEESYGENIEVDKGGVPVLAMITNGNNLTPKDRWLFRRVHRKVHRKKTDRFATVGPKTSKQSRKVRTIDAMEVLFPYILPSTQSLNRANNSSFRSLLHLK